MVNETKYCRTYSVRTMCEKSKFYRVSYVLLLITVFINVTFPKAGIKLGGIPLTVGNVFLLLTIMMWFFYVLWRRCFIFSKAERLVVIGCLYWLIRFLLTMVGGRAGLSDWVGFFVPLVVYPFTFLVFNFFITEQRQIDLILRMLMWGTIIVFIFGFLQAAFGIERFSIPGLTVNYTDYISSTNWYAEKYNGVQDGVTYSKTVSTYQNGNLLGVNILLFCPMIYESIKKKVWQRVYMLVFVLFCILTGSKTCWVGIFLYLFIKSVVIINRKWADGRKVQFACLIIAVIPVIAAIFLNMFPQILERFKDSFTLKNINDLSGRSESMSQLIDYFVNKTEWILIGPYGLTSYWGSSYEMAYFCILMIGGIAGLVAFLGPIIYILVKYIGKHIKDSKVLKGVCHGLVVYIIIAFVEGALWLPPTAVNLWMVLALGYKMSLFMEEN